MNFRKVNNITGWIVFLIASAAYIFTRETAGSLWDCGEFVASAYKVQNPHPPGAPTFVLIGRFFIILFGAGNPAGAVNLMSAIVSAFTILFLFWTITHFARKMFVAAGEELSGQQLFTVMASGVVGALAYTFSDSFWFSAVEGEVYAFSSFFTALVFWAMLKWEHADEKAGNDAVGRSRADRWIVFLFFMMGLSVGVHLLNLLTIPAIVMIYYFRRYTYSLKGAITAFIAGCVIVGIVQVGAIQFTMKGAGLFDIFIVNTFSLPFFSGFALYFIILAVIIWYGLRFNEKTFSKTKFTVWLAVLLIILLIPFFYTSEFGIGTILKILLAIGISLIGLLIKNIRVLKTIKLALWCFAFMMLGYSTYVISIIRANADTAIDMNDVSDPMSLVYYLSREQYGSAPIVYGPHFLAQPTGLKEKEMRYVKSNNKYIAIGRDKEYEYTDGMQLFPRIWDNSNDQNHFDFYVDWLGLGNKADDFYQITKAAEGQSYVEAVNLRTQQKRSFNIDENYEVRVRPGQQVRAGDNIAVRKPTYGDNLEWFITYQNGLMYWRYLMWNFAGKQNDIQGYGNLRDGNWISGVPFVDNIRLGNQEKMPDLLKNNKANNKLYLIPFILAIFGCVYHFIRHRKDWFVNFLLFFFTGFAILIYLNQPGNQPRERDYAFVGSFYAFAVWIGLAVASLVKMTRDKENKIDFTNTLLYGSLLSFVITALSTSYNGLADSFLTSALVAILYAAVSAVVYFAVKAASSNGSNLRTANITAALIGMIAPLLMAKEELGDHDRNGKKVAVDLARNYLESCDKNAILFTFGDNDTYPLWYAQEVEGVRPDIRIINNSLLGIDWYINQLRYKINESDPLDVIWDADQIAGHKREALYFKQEITDPEFYDLYDFMKNAMGKRDATGQDIDLSIDSYRIPIRRFSLPVDVDLVKKNGTVNNTDSVVGKINFEVSKGVLQRNDFAMLNIIAANNWKRPVYFTSPYGELGFGQYVRQDGMSYRLVPVVTKSNSANWIASPFASQPENQNAMFKNVMEKFEFTSKKGVYFDEENRHHIISIRNTFAKAAGNLADANRKEDAQKVLNKAEQLIPESAMPYAMPSRLGIYHNYYGLLYLEAAYKTGNKELAGKVKKQIAESFKQEKNYYDYIITEKIEKAADLANDRNALAEQLQMLDEIEKKYNPSATVTPPPVIETPGGGKIETKAPGKDSNK
jgi:hypothetical protein